ncbi:hypothetical protein [Falsirhodobacter halotolerans]|uniref:hypothetical protein n=1 Tax=Falsirhodobacter halotolerans TaxID=1146892 RepID=UPI001FD063D0|nr:hypothetical protein [Falsirhodobacter halotolerans]MCJ8138279.1 hypothetical protein [Falsirhodobacter halotolerans]
MRGKTCRKGPLHAAALAAALAFSPISVTAQEKMVERSFATALIRDVLAAVNHGNWTGNYTVVRDYAAADFAAANDPTRLAGLFVQLRAERLDLTRVLVTDPVILNAQLTEGQDQMRLTGYFPLQPDHVSFDLTFAQEGSRWLLTGISVGAFDAIGPE